MQTIVEMKQELGRHVEVMSKIQKASEKDRRDLTIDEQAEWNSLETEVRRLEGAISRGEIQERREAEMAKTAYHRGENGRASDGLDGITNGRSGGYETTSAILRPDQSVRAYLQEHGLIRKPEYEGLTFGGFLRATVTGARNDLERRALGEASDSTGGFGVPNVVFGPFIDKMRAATVTIRAGAKTIPLTSDKTTIARTASDPVATWRTENAAVNVSDSTYEGVVFEPKSLAVIVRVSRELLEDSLNVEQMLEASFAGSMALELDRVALVGSGIAPEPLGITGQTNVGAVSSVGKPADYSKFTAGLYELWVDNEMTVTGMVMHPRTLVTLSDMVTGISSDKTPLRAPDVISAIPQFTTTSIPINLGGGTNESLVIMGNFARLMIGVRSSLRVEVLRELYAGNHQYGFLAHLRADVAVEHPESFCVLSGVTA